MDELPDFVHAQMRYFFSLNKAEKGDNRFRFCDLNRSSAVFISYRTPSHKHDTLNERKHFRSIRVILLSAPPDTAGAGQISNETDIWRRVIPL